MKRTTLAIAIALCALLFAADTANAAGFEVAELSVRQLGNAYAGKAASGSDAAIAFFNPAGMTLFEKSMVSVPIHLLQTRGSWNDDGSTGSPFLGSPPLSGDDGGDPGGFTVIPCMYFIWALNEDFRVGLSINTPYGLTTEYDDDWQGRYNALKSSLVTFNFNPSVAYRIDEMFSVGAGISWMHAEAELTQTVDYGSIAAGAGVPGVAPQGADGFAGIEGDGDAFSWNIGFLIELSENTRFGLAYRSRIMVNIEGDAEFDVPASAAPITGGGSFVDTKGATRLKLPDQLYLSFFTKVAEDWDVMADITWTGWSYFEEIRITYDNPNQPVTVMPEDWNDVLRYSVGANWRPREDLTVRIGMAYDESPIPSSTRTPRIPTNDRFWFALGVSWQIDEMMSADFAWMHVFIEDGDIDQDVVTGQNLQGKFEGSADVFGLQFNISF
ncbi:MAG: outer membrane protein transport protein [Planctomycetota bacterium]